MSHTTSCGLPRQAVQLLAAAACQQVHGTCCCCHRHLRQQQRRYGQPGGLLHLHHQPLQLLLLLPGCTQTGPHAAGVPGTSAQQTAGPAPLAAAAHTQPPLRLLRLLSWHFAHRRCSGPAQGQPLHPAAAAAPASVAVVAAAAAARQVMPEACLLVVARVCCYCRPGPGSACPLHHWHHCHCHQVQQQSCCQWRVPGLKHH